MPLHDDMHMDSFFQNITILPKLRTFRLAAHLYHPHVLNMTFASAFLSSHNTIEVLRWCVICEPLELLLGSLPLLSEVSSHPDQVLEILSTPIDVPRPLETILDVHCGAKFYEALKFVDPTTVIRLQISHFESVQDIYRLPNELPNLTWIKVDVTDSLWDHSTRTFRKFLNVSTIFITCQLWLAVIRNH